MAHHIEPGRGGEAGAGEGPGGGDVLGQVAQARRPGAVALPRGVEHQRGDAMAPEDRLGGGPLGDGLLEAVVDQDRRRILAVGRGADEIAVEQPRAGGDRHPLERHAEAGGGQGAVGAGAQGLADQAMGHHGADGEDQRDRGQDGPDERGASHPVRTPGRKVSRAIIIGPAQYRGPEARRQPRLMAPWAGPPEGRSPSRRRGS